jgi:hypothetical protein
MVAFKQINIVQVRPQKVLILLSFEWWLHLAVDAKLFTIFISQKQMMRCDATCHRNPLLLGGNNLFKDFTTRHMADVHWTI